ncbi:MAG: selenoneine biosynthesis selenosugar synthase SenB [bacterium]|nr:selenoneine biosynthesis selenosugar synthase SenB [bacterium]
MKISLISPAGVGSRKGNRVTAARWGRLLRALGHKVKIGLAYEGENCDLLIALHAKRSHGAVTGFRKEYPGRPLIVAMTGTDLYDIRVSAQAQESIELADRLIVLHQLGAEALPRHLRKKARPIHQSVVPPPGDFSPKKGVFEVCVIGHLRAVKDPFRAAKAAQHLPASSRVQIIHLGGALTEEMAVRAKAEAAANPRYRWLGEVPRWKALRILSRCRLHVLSSEMEGGANAVGEAIACSVPTLSSKIAGSLGLLGADYPGYFPPKDTKALARLLRRAEEDSRFYRELKRKSDRRRRLFAPEQEQKSLQRLLEELRKKSA